MSSISSNEISLSPPIEKIGVLNSPISRRPKSFYSQISTNKSEFKFTLSLIIFDKSHYVILLKHLIKFLITVFG